jgi:hypothetical protein
VGVGVCVSVKVAVGVVLAVTLAVTDGVCVALTPVDGGTVAVFPPGAQALAQNSRPLRQRKGISRRDINHHPWVYTATGEAERRPSVGHLPPARPEL